LAEFGVAVKVFHGMVVGMRDGIGGADIGAGKTGDTIIDLLDHTETLFLVQFENVGRTDVDTEFAPPAGLFMNNNLK
jgi:hypothetical protein